MRKVFVSFLFTITGIVVFGQVEIGADYYFIGEYNPAKKYLEEGLAKNPAVANFYLGEIAFKEGDMVKAESYYNKGLAAEANSWLNQIGLAKLLLKKDVRSAESALFEIGKKNSKNIDILIAIGRAYLDNGMFEQAEMKLKDASKVSNKNAKVNIFDGDIIAAKKDVNELGNAASKYDMAVYFDANNCLALFKLADIYEKINPALSIENMKKVVETCPEYTVAYRILGRIYTQNGGYTQAIEAYKAYFNSTEQPSIDDIEKYARAYYFTGKYEDATTLVEQGLKIDPNHFVLNRYLMYILIETKDFENALGQVKKFFSLRPDVSGYIYLDYTMYASMLKELKRYNEAIEQCNTAIQLDPEKSKLYKEAFDMARAKKDFGLAATYFKDFMVKKAEEERKTDPEFEDDLGDIYTLSYNYYLAGANISKNLPLAEELIKNTSIINSIIAGNKAINTDSLKTDTVYFSKHYSLYMLYKADSVVDILTKLIGDDRSSSNIYTDYRLKALIQFAINPVPEVGSAKPYYEKVVEIITSKENIEPSVMQILMEAYRYLGFYYYEIKDKPNTILYWSKILEIDPENEPAKVVLNEMNKK